MSFLGRIRDSLSRTTQQILGRFDEIVRRADDPQSRTRPVDVETVEALEELLLSADVGVAATRRIIAAVQAQSSRTSSLRDLVRRKFAPCSRPSIVPSWWKRTPG